MTRDALGPIMDRLAGLQVVSGDVEHGVDSRFERLGPGTPSFTLDVYGWVMTGMQAEAAAVFCRLMSADPVEEPVEAKKQGPR